MFSVLWYFSGTMSLSACPAVLDRASPALINIGYIHSNITKGWPTSSMAKTADLFKSYTHTHKAEAIYPCFEK